MAKGSRNNKGLAGFVWNPFRHFFMAVGESAKKVGSGAGKVAKDVVNTARGVGNSLATHTNQALRGVTRRSGRRNASTRRRRAQRRA